MLRSSIRSESCMKSLNQTSLNGGCNQLYFVRNCRAILLALIFAGCGSKPSDFDLASRAIYAHKTNDLALILTRDRAVVTNVSGFDGATLLHYALVNLPDIPCAKLLVEAGADVNRPDRTGATPLHLVCASGAHLDAVSFLLDHGVQVNPLNGAGETPLRFSRNWSRDKEGIDLLVKHGATE
jgi:ankyrin repeat protein